MIKSIFIPHTKLLDDEYLKALDDKLEGLDAIMYQEHVTIHSPLELFGTLLIINKRKKAETIDISDLSKKEADQLIFKLIDEVRTKYGQYGTSGTSGPSEDSNTALNSFL